ncbi:unnamed protein product [Miscanthus lutarioriparius]|uniref:Uncharacterized protein n=1 Tax=Miscanthus lutarioriparius TaxID=422564 RepID=A0A811RJ92_9POAL|nr:unnamed protein product [Miscanthus lutarioriparius]
MASPCRTRPGAIPVPRCPVIFNGTNWGDFVFHPEVHMDGQLLWGYLTGEQVCPPYHVLPMSPTYPPNADDDAKTSLLDAFEAQMESCQSDLSVYETWLREKSAKAILLASMEVDLARSLREAMPELRAEETRLRAGGVSRALLQPSVLVATPPPVSPPLSQSSVGAGVPSGVQCGHCKLYGHKEKDCRKKQRNRYGRHDRRHSQGSGGSSSTSQGTRSVSAAEQEVLALFRCLTTAAQSSAHGTTTQAFAHGTTTQASSSTPPPP